MQVQALHGGVGETAQLDVDGGARRWDDGAELRAVQRDIAHVQLEQVVGGRLPLARRGAFEARAQRVPVAIDEHQRYGDVRVAGGAVLHNHVAVVLAQVRRKRAAAEPRRAVAVGVVGKRHVGVLGGVAGVKRHKLRRQPRFDRKHVGRGGADALGHAVGDCQRDASVLRDVVPRRRAKDVGAPHSDQRAHSGVESGAANVGKIDVVKVAVIHNQRAVDKRAVMNDNAGVDTETRKRFWKNDFCEKKPEIQMLQQ